MNQARITAAARPAAVQEIVDLRHAILRPGLPRETAHFAGDDHPDTLHFGLFDDAGECLACLTALRAEHQGQAAWQLRGMAVARARQKQGLGRQLLAYVEAELARRPGPRLLWCNARAHVVPFYRKQGWLVVSEVFDIPGVGPHHRMTRRLETAG